MAPGGVVSVLGQSWCGKNNKAGSPTVPPGGEFPVPTTSDVPLLALRCGPAIFGTEPISDTSNNLSVTVCVNGEILASGTVPLNATKHPLSFSLSALQPGSKAYIISCQRFHLHTTPPWAHLSEKPVDIGSVTKMDMCTGVLLANLLTAVMMGPTGRHSRLTPTPSLISWRRTYWLNLIHIVPPFPPFGNLTVLEEVLDEMQRVGLYLMYDMRGQASESDNNATAPHAYFRTYMNDTSITGQRHTFLVRLRVPSSLLGPARVTKAVPDCCDFRAGKCAGPVISQERGGGCSFGNPQGSSLVKPPPTTVLVLVQEAASLLAFNSLLVRVPTTASAPLDAVISTPANVLVPSVALEGDGGFGFGDAQPNDNAARRPHGQP
uniref:Uncharacterized protein n=1 Tax=Moniliophthora roreri TaxID=221103 RepID=A0A0W0FBD7_MONRR